MTDHLKITNAVTNAIRALPNKLAAEAVNFSKQRFVQQNWVDNTTTMWPKRKKTDAGRAILVKSGRLKRSIRKLAVYSDCIIIGTDVPYAKIHNDGFRGVEQAKAHSRKSKKGKAYQVKSFTRPINMPKRQFIGASAVLTAKLDRLATAELIRAIKQSM